MEQAQIPHLVPGAVVPVSIGSLHILHIQQLLAHIATPELQKKVEDKQQLLPWEEGVISLVLLMQEVHRSAQLHGLLEFKSVEEFVGKSL